MKASMKWISAPAGLCVLSLLVAGCSSLGGSLSLGGLFDMATSEEGQALIKSCRLREAKPLLEAFSLDDPDSRFIRALHSHASGDLNAAFIQYQKAEGCSDDSDLAYLKAECLREAGEVDRAFQGFLEWIEKEPLSVRSWVGAMGALCRKF